jgi:hypothetical protein
LTYLTSKGFLARCQEECFAPPASYLYAILFGYFYQMIPIIIPMLKKTGWAKILQMKNNFCPDNILSTLNKDRN